MNTVLKTVACLAITIGLHTSAHAQRSIGARSISLDDGAGGIMLITTIAPTSGTFTIPPGGGTASPSGTVSGQMLRWNTALVPPAWEIASATNVGANFVSTGTVTGTNFIGNLNGETNAQLHAAGNLTGQVAVANGGTGGNAAGTARANLGAAQSGTNGDITQLTGLTTPLSVGQGGTGTTGFAINGVLYGQAAGAIPATAASAGNGAFLQTTASAGAPTFKTILDIPNGGTNASTAAGARTNLGLGTMSTQNANAVAITGGAIDGTPIGTTTPGTITGTTVTASTGDVTATAGKVRTGATLGNAGTPVAGGVYVDNILRAWGNIPAAGTTANGSFGIGSYTHVNGSGVYVFTLSTTFASTSDASVVVSSRDANRYAVAYFSGANQITVSTFSDFGVTAADVAFCFQVAGR